MTQVTQLTDELYVLSADSINAGLLKKDGRALLLDCHVGCTQDLLYSLGVCKLDGILLTQYRRDLLGGINNWTQQGVPIICSNSVADILENAGDRWSNSFFRWQRFSSLMPDLTMPEENISVTYRISLGDHIKYPFDSVVAIDASGAGPGALAWFISSGSLRVLFCGSAALAGGHLQDLWSLQRGFSSIQDYHGILGAASDLHQTWKRFLALHLDILVSSFGSLDNTPANCLSQLSDRLTRLQKNIVKASGLNHYFPEVYYDLNHTWPRLQAVETFPLPSFVVALGGTSFLLRSQEGTGFLIDCGDLATADLIIEQFNSGSLKNLEGVWITHYHSDHIEGLSRLLDQFSCPVYASRLTADVLRYPNHYFLPCQHPESLPVTGLSDRNEFKWREFTVTACEFPGQTLHHGGLLVQKTGQRVLFVGDSFSPTGFDDYCPQNRVLPEKNRGMRCCLDLIREFQPDCLINQHQQKAFHFSADELDVLEQVLIEREYLTQEITNRSPGWGWDDAWFRVYPFEQKKIPGAVVKISVHITNHDHEPLPISAEPVLSNNFHIVDGPSIRDGIIPPLTSGSVLSEHRSDLSLTWQIKLPDNLISGDTIRLLFRVNCRVHNGLAGICLIHVV